MHDEKAGLYTREGSRVALRGVDVTGELLGGHARVRVSQRYRNTESRPIEAVYVFPLPSDATLTGFSMECAGRRVHAVLQERERAFRTYDDAVTAGHGAALLDQERPNVFTAQVGNLLPGEETRVEVEFLQALSVEEGCVRWSLPTLVAPRYIPGTPGGDRSSHGVAEPTDRVPDADRITPPVGDASYGLSLDLLVALGREVVVESPSHALRLEETGGGARVHLARPDVALERDLVLTVRGMDADAAFAPLVAHRRGSEPGTFALTVVPDLLGLSRAPPRQEVVFVVDVSGSMEGESLPQAQGALRLCLRHLREGDRFNIIAFENTHHLFSPEPVSFTQRTMEQADRWVAGLRANGGTELLAPMQAAMKAVPEGVVVLLTDGQVGNEEEILRAVLAERRTARVYSFGIGTNVSDVLLRDLARRTDGAVEFIHPGERIDDKVVAQFSRALAPRVTNVEVRWEGVEAQELSPTELPPLVDGMPWSLFGRYTTPGTGRVVLQGRVGTERFSLSLPMDFPAVSERPVVEKLWAAERIRGWQAAELVGRRAEALQARIVQLALAHGLVTPHTSFVVVEERTGERRASGTPETRVIPVHAPAGWAMFQRPAEEQEEGAAGPGAPPVKKKARGALARLAGALLPASPKKSAPAPAPAPGGPPAGAFPVMPAPAAPASAASSPPPPFPAPAPAPEASFQFPKSVADDGMEYVVALAPKADVPDGSRFGRARHEKEEAPVLDESSAHEGGVALLGQQLASGLWAGQGAGGEPTRQARATALALLELLRQGITSGHALHGGQVKKAVEALLALLPSLPTQEAEVAELALGVAWLVSAGPRTRGRITQAARPHTGLSARLGDDGALRQHVDTLATR